MFLRVFQSEFHIFGAPPCFPRRFSPPFHLSLAFFLYTRRLLGKEFTEVPASLVPNNLCLLHVQLVPMRNNLVINNSTCLLAFHLSSRCPVRCVFMIITFAVCYQMNTYAHNSQPLWLVLLIMFINLLNLLACDAARINFCCAIKTNNISELANSRLRIHIKIRLDLLFNSSSYAIRRY